MQEEEDASVHLVMKGKRCFNIWKHTYLVHDG